MTDTPNTQGASWEERFKADWDSGALSWNGNVENGISYERVKERISKERAEGERIGKQEAVEYIKANKSGLKSLDDSYTLVSNETLLQAAVGEKLSDISSME